MKIVLDALKNVVNGCVEYGDFTLKSGAKSTWYLDCRKVTLRADGAYIIATALKHVLDPQSASNPEFDAIGGPCVGADPIVGAYLGYCMLHDPPMRGFLIRKEEKDHGKDGLVIGSVLPGDKCVVVEDVTTSGGSLMNAIANIQLFGCEVVRAVTLVDRQQGAEKLFERAGIPFSSLLRIEDLEINDE